MNNTSRSLPSMLHYGISLISYNSCQSQPAAANSEKHFMFLRVQTNKHNEIHPNVTAFCYSIRGTSCHEIKSKVILLMGKVEQTNSVWLIKGWHHAVLWSTSQNISYRVYEAGEHPRNVKHGKCTAAEYSAEFHMLAAGSKWNEPALITTL